MKDITGQHFVQPSIIRADVDAKRENAGIIRPFLCPVPTHVCAYVVVPKQPEYWLLKVSGKLINRPKLGPMIPSFVY